MFPSTSATLLAAVASLSCTVLAGDVYPATTYGQPARFNTQRNRPWYNPSLYEEGTFPLSINYSAPSWKEPSRIAMGLSLLDFGIGHPMIVNASVKAINSTNITAALSSGEDSVMHVAASQWLEVSRFPSMQSGVYDLPPTTSGGGGGGSGSGRTQRSANNSQRITFAKPYAQAPQVLLFFKALGLDASSADYNVRTYPTDVDASGFTAHIDAEAGSSAALFGAASTWLAFPSDLPGLQGGTFSTTEIRSPSNPSGSNSGLLQFERRFRSGPSAAFVALNQFWIGRERNLRLNADWVSLSPTGMQWSLESWADTVQYSSGATWIAWAT